MAAVVEVTYIPKDHVNKSHDPGIEPHWFRKQRQRNSSNDVENKFVQRHAIIAKFVIY